MTKATEIIKYMESLYNEEQRQVLMRFFKTGKGEYGEGDEFLGLKVPQTRQIVKQCKECPLSEVPKLLMSRWHEVRLCGLLLMVSQFERLSKKRLEYDGEVIRKRDEILTMYLQYADRANNWDLVDISAPKILGAWLLLPTQLGDGTDSHKLQVLDGLARSQSLWRQPHSRVMPRGACVMLRCTCIIRTT